MLDCERNVLHVRIAVNVRMVVCGTHENGSHRCLWTVVPSVRIVILCARVASCSTSILHRRIAVCRSYRHLREPSFQARESSFYVYARVANYRRIILHTRIAVCGTREPSPFAGAIVLQARESPFYARELLVAGESFFKRELLFAGAIVPSMRIIILCARVTSCRRIVLHTRIAVCKSHCSMRENRRCMSENC